MIWFEVRLSCFLILGNQRVLQQLWARAQGHKVHIIQIQPANMPKTQIGYIDFKGGQGGQTGQGYFTIIIYTVFLFSL